ncbi:IS110 family transposase [Gordonia sp. (in: high G+C Gram-positive bacteria)]|nr:IS110 family transposase [Gordonia sp. (in: high G+C Gram-positive bacteria)]
MLITAGDNTNRIKSEAAFAKMCGACPIPAGSGKTNNRHRLYRGGNRPANAALYRVSIVRMRWHQPTIDSVPWGNDTLSIGPQRLSRLSRSPTRSAASARPFPSAARCPAL